MNRETESTPRTPAAGPWQAGEPPREGRYLIEYRQGRVQRVFIGDWIDGYWSSILSDTEILQWAEIHEPEASMNDTTPRTPGLEERLRAACCCSPDMEGWVCESCEAADEIARLAAERDALEQTVKDRAAATERMVAKIERLQRRIAAGQDAINPEGAER